MSTEKSCLNYVSYAGTIATINKGTDELVLPIGVTPGNNVEYVRLMDDCVKTNALVLGVTGSGKTKFMHFILQALTTLYGDTLKIHYIDGMNCEINVWRETQRHGCRISNPGILIGCETHELLANAVHCLYEYVSNMVNECWHGSELVVFDEIVGLLNGCSVSVMWELQFILTYGPSVGVHSIVASQYLNDALDSFSIDEFKLVCTTRVPENVSQQIYGSDIGAMVRKYGDLTYRFEDAVGRLRVPMVYNK